MENCIFCKIIAKEIPTHFLMETEDLVVFRDINPKAPVHLLIVPRQHIRSINNIEENHTVVLGKLFLAAREMAAREGISASGYKLQFNVEKGGGQEVFHLHLHLIGGWKS
ncbi:histidine triad nucleotide-binding protein [Desulfobotulus sp.]|jgi:histidine triad (HIT) family protein|uniref:histidine triad nucleotide-binding protein n=1 Tax=Desulfobotulus sp. TaxID=1940337 RepID=UPI002A36E771|nr:histidine triad nucleotide-binding protein [Desulfobotulus sp.]MDY0162966.1 histidine triad nucleotide-binding protein [Desulfobotulus sp.]